MRMICDGYELDVDIQKTEQYYRSHSLCDCSACKSFCLQAKSAFPALSSFLADFGVDISRPDETGSSEKKGEIEYHFVAYTVTGKIKTLGEYEIDIKDGDLFLSVVIDHSYVPNEQTSDYFTITVYGIRLPKSAEE